MAPARVTLLSTYELGHQPLGLATAAAALRARGHDVQSQDLAVEALDASALRDADLIAISVPMHTAARLALRLVPTLRALNPRARLCLYGLYASLLHEQEAIDVVAGGEYEAALCDLADSLAAREEIDRARPGLGARPEFARATAPVPDRVGLAPLERYARLHAGERVALAGYVECSRGCAHRCGHCPWTAVYEGRLRLVDASAVLADIEQQLALGAEHITFGDPDFLNAVPHSLAIAEELHQRHPDVTFDATIKVEHLLEHPALLPRLRALGCLFVTSAFESTSDEVLRELHKGHSAADLARALRLCEEAGLALRPTWVAFNPWASVEDFVAQLAFIERRELIGHAEPVQLALRLLVPPSSALIEPLREQGLLGDYDAEGLTYRWRPRDGRVDALHAAVARIVEADAHAPAPPPAHETFARVQVAALGAAGLPPRAGAAPPAPRHAIPGLTESWFC